MNSGNYAQYQFYFNVFQFLFTCLIGIAAWWRTREKADSAKLTSASADMQKKLEAAKKEQAIQFQEHKQERDRQCQEHKLQHDRQCQEHRNKTSALEEKFSTLQINISSLPTKQNIERIHERLDGLMELMGGMKGEVKAMSNTLNLLQEHHLDGGK